MFNFPAIRKNRIDSLFRIDNLFEEFFKAPFKWGLAGFEALPAVDIYEKGDKITVRAEIPGLKPEELNVSVEEDSLTISGEKKYEKELKSEDCYRLEASYGSFERRLRLPEAVKAEEAKAAYKDGVLKIELPKSEEARKKKVKINVNPVRNKTL